MTSSSRAAPINGADNIASGRVDLLDMDPAAVELQGVDVSLECDRRARRLDEHVLRPPHCSLAALASSGTARGALAAETARSTLTRANRHRWRRERMARLAAIAGLARAVGAVA